MEYRRLGHSGFEFLYRNFGGKGEFFGAWGNIAAAEARRMVDICLAVADRYGYARYTAKQTYFP